MLTILSVEARKLNRSLAALLAIAAPSLIAVFTFFNMMRGQVPAAWDMWMMSASATTAGDRAAFNCTPGVSPLQSPHTRSPNWLGDSPPRAGSAHRLWRSQSVSSALRICVSLRKRTRSASRASRSSNERFDQPGTARSRLAMKRLSVAWFIL